MNAKFINKKNSNLITGSNFNNNNNSYKLLATNVCKPSADSASFSNVFITSKRKIQTLDLRRNVLIEFIYFQCILLLTIINNFIKGWMYHKTIVFIIYNIR